MKRNGLILAGGIIAIIRGALGSLTALGGFASIELIEEVAPGYAVIFVFESFLSVGILILGIYAVAKANDPGAARTIRGGAFAVIAAGIVDFVWAAALFGGSAEVIAGGLGSVVALLLIGGLLAAGASRLQTERP